MGQFDGLPKTTSLKLNKPGYDNVADILALNENADILDSKIAEILNAIIIASQNEAELGNDNAKMMTPLRVKQAILKLAPKPAIASQAEAEAGTDNTKHMTALRVKQSILKNAPVPDLTPYAKLASPAFTGTPTAPTVAKTTNNTQIATTAFVHALTGAVNNGGIVAQSLGQNGFVKFANGLILQWGYLKLNKPQGTITVPLNVTATPFVAFGIVDYLNRATHDGMSGMYVSSDGFTDTAITFYPDWSSSNIINGLMWVCVSKA